MNKPDAFLELSRRDGLVRAADAGFTPLTRGVSCEIHLSGNGLERFWVKRALARLKVKAEWRAIGRAQEDINPAQ